jgi:uncharacterized membrane protein YqgA involved in biofilm formation
MVIGLGTLVNAGTVIVGGALGSRVIPSIPENVQKTTMQAVGLCVTLIGLQMAWTTKNLLMVLVAMAVGAVAGELLKLDERLRTAAGKLERLPGIGSGGGLAKGFVQATLLFCVGAMAITGALQDGLSADPSTLYAKAVIDGISAIVMGSILGPGVILSAVPVLLYQGAITLGATGLSHIMTQPVINEVGATGGLMVAGLGLSLLGIVEIKVANLLPALVVVAVLVGFGL